MSRIGRAPIAVPANVKVAIKDRHVQVDGPKGKLAFTLPEPITASLQGQVLSVQRPDDAKSSRALHGLSRAILANMVHGVVNGFSRELEIQGVGYRAQLQGKQLSVNVGFTHPVVVDVPQGLTVQVPKPTSVVVSGPDKQQVGQFAANLRRIAPPEPYKGKGIRYVGEVVRRKAGKAATGSGAKAA